MISENAATRVQKLDEAKELLVRLEDEKGMQLGGPRGTLMRAGQTVSSAAFVDNMQKAAGQIAGLAIEGGHDEIASDVAALIDELQTECQEESK